MDTEQNAINKILSLDDNTFADVIKETAAAAGVGKLKTAAMLSDVSALKKRISKLTPDEISEKLLSADEEKIGEILKVLKGRGIEIEF